MISLSDKPRDRPSDKPIYKPSDKLSDKPTLSVNMANPPVMISLPCYEGFSEFAIWFEPQSVRKLIILHWLMSQIFYILFIKLINFEQFLWFSEC